MQPVSITRFIIVATVILAGNTVSYADELRESLPQQGTTQVADVTDLNYRRGLAVDAAPIGDTQGVRYSGDVAPATQCACTNHNSVTVICKDCDSETNGNRCVTHDRGCQDAAQVGGIREHGTFFCTVAD